MGRMFSEFHREQIERNPGYREAYEGLAAEFAIAEALIRARMEAGLTQAQVAEKMGISQPRVAQFESGRNLTIKSLVGYATAVGKTLNLQIRPAQ